MLLGILLTFLVVVCVLLITVILMQRSEGGALGMGGGGGGFLSTRGTADLLTRTTQVLGAIFFILCLAITVVTGRTERSGSLIDQTNVGKLDPNLLKKAPAQPAPPPTDNGFQAPVPSIGGAPSPAAPAPTGGSPFQAPVPSSTPAAPPTK
ncbi:MAG TPA: preprotein translocase subunit SecG [Caulobacteraceae bacterium]|nr:preprotein translocase subunit SecG [Caulobacteraceae bacterium]